MLLYGKRQAIIQVFTRFRGIFTLTNFLFPYSVPNVWGFSPNFVSISLSDNFSGNSDVPRSLSTLLAQARSMLTIRVHIFASRPSDDCSDVPVGSF